MKLLVKEDEIKAREVKGFEWLTKEREGKVR